MNRTLATFVLLLAGCAPSFEMQLSDRFVVLGDDAARHSSGYVQRATTVDGVVIGLRALEHRVRGPLPFWSEAVLRRMRDGEGYALLSRDDVQAANGQRGTLLRFGRDLNGRPYRYTVAVFVTDSRLWIVDAGGREEAFVSAESEIERSIQAVRF